MVRSARSARCPVTEVLASLQACRALYVDLQRVSAALCSR